MSHGPAALTTTDDPMYTARLLRRLSDALLNVDAAYRGVVSEYARARKNYQEQMTRIGATLVDAYRSEAHEPAVPVEAAAVSLESSRAGSSAAEQQDGARDA